MKVKYLGTLAMASALGLSLAATGCSGGSNPCAGNPCAGEKTENPCASETPLIPAPLIPGAGEELS